MQLILLRDVDNLGLRGDVVEVAPGYARNYLLPRRLAERATPGRIADLRRREELRARQEARTLAQAEQIAGELRKTVLRLDVNAGPTGALFGSITPTDIVDEIWRVRRIRVDRRKVELDEPIKRVGRYDIPIEVFEGVRVEVKTLVVPEGGELPPEEEAAPAEATVAPGGGEQEPSDEQEPPGELEAATTSEAEQPRQAVGEPE